MNGCLHKLIAVLSIVTWGPLFADGETRWFTVRSTQETAIVSFAPDGLLTWSNASVGAAGRVVWTSLGNGYWVTNEPSVAFVSTGELCSVTLSITSTVFMSEGIVRFTHIEGGCWYIVDSRDSRILEPMGLPTQYKVDGMRIRFVARPRHDVASICQVGDEIVQIYDVQPF